MREKIIAIILAGGTGERMGGELPKQFMELSGKPVITYSVEAFDKSDVIDEIIIVCHEKHMERMTDIVDIVNPGKNCKIVAGGKTRQESSFIGVKNCPSGTEFVLIHDAVRPFVSERIIKDVLEAAGETGAAMSVVDMDDTVVVVEAGMVGEVPDRNTLKRVQTPQGFKHDIILKAHEQALKTGIKDSTDDCSLVVFQGKPVRLVKGATDNIKITTKQDMLF